VAETTPNGGLRVVSAPMGAAEPPLGAQGGGRNHPQTWFENKISVVVRWEDHSEIWCQLPRDSNESLPCSLLGG
jgi:hypothetical protein